MRQSAVTMSAKRKKDDQEKDKERGAAPSQSGVKHEARRPCTVRCHFVEKRNRYSPELCGSPLFLLSLSLCSLFLCFFVVIPIQPQGVQKKRALKVLLLVAVNAWCLVFLRHTLAHADLH